MQQINYPVGLGLKYEFGTFNLRAEFLYRILSTDYLDDLSTRYIKPTVFANYFSGSQLADALALNDRRSKIALNIRLTQMAAKYEAILKTMMLIFLSILKLVLLSEGKKLTINIH